MKSWRRCQKTVNKRSHAAQKTIRWFVSVKKWQRWAGSSRRNRVVRNMLSSVLWLTWSRQRLWHNDVKNNINKVDVVSITTKYVTISRDVKITNTFCKFSRTSHVEETFLVRTNSNNVWCRSQLIYCNQLREHCVTENVPWDLIGASVVITHCY